MPCASGFFLFRDKIWPIVLVGNLSWRFFMSDLVVVPTPHGEGGEYVSLSRTPQGRLIRKQILHIGKAFTHPADPTHKIVVDKKMAETIKRNFDKGISMVQVPIVNDKNAHVEDPLRNAGEVVDIDYDETGVYATIDARKYADEFGKTILGASAMLHLNYLNTETGERVGPTLLHVAATNRPHVMGLQGYEDAIKASAAADSTDETVAFLYEEDGGTVSLSNHSEDETMTLEEMLAALKADHGIDVPALQAEAARAAELSGQLDDVNSQLQLSGKEGITVTDLAEALVELSSSNKTLTTKVEALEADKAAMELSAAETEIDSLIKAGRVLPKQRDVMVKLSMEDRETFETLLPEKAIVSLSETGVEIHEERDDESTRAAAMERYSKMADKLAAKRKTR